MARYNPSFPSSWSMNIQPDAEDESDSSRSSTPTPPTPPTPSISGVSTSTADFSEPQLSPPRSAPPNNTQTNSFSTHFPSSWVLPSSGPSPLRTGPRPYPSTNPGWDAPQRAATIIGGVFDPSQVPRQRLRMAHSFSVSLNRNQGHEVPPLSRLRQQSNLTDLGRLSWPNRQGQAINPGVVTAAAGGIYRTQLTEAAEFNTTGWYNRGVQKKRSLPALQGRQREGPTFCDTKILTSASYTIACVCPMGVELAAVKGMLDKEHPSLPMTQNRNSYTLGEMGGHNVVIAVMPAIGENVAAVVVIQLLNDFPSVRFGLLVGIGGGIPVKHEYDIRLGDVVVGTPTRTSSSVVQFDQGKIRAGGSFERTGTLNKPPAVLMAHLHKLQAQHLVDGSAIPQYLTEMLQSHPMMDKDQWTYQGFEHDLLFEASYSHQGDQRCDGCDRSRLINREPRRLKTPGIHYGTIGSSNLVVRDALTRERLRKEFGIICVEMEAAGLVDEFPCLVIRGICDYADSHKNKRWQPYAAATAAAFAKELLSTIAG